MSDTTSLPFRRAGKRGQRRSPEVPESLHLESHREAAPAPAPPSGDVTQGRTDWGMDHNDDYSCCGPAATDHNIMAKIGPTAQPDQLGGKGVLPLYWQYGVQMGWQGPPDAPNHPDGGVDNATWLKFLFDLGIIEGFAKLNHKDPNEVHAGMLNFNGVIVAVDLTDDAESLFGNHQPWTVAQGQQPDPEMGHDICLAAYGSQGDQFITWGGLQWATVDWDADCIIEAWVILTKEDAARNGVNLAALQDAIRAWGGTVQVPAQGKSLIQRIGEDLERGAERVVDDIRSAFTTRVPFKPYCRGGIPV